jgi:Tfp pilus assembly protein PilF
VTLARFIVGLMRTAIGVLIWTIALVPASAQQAPVSLCNLDLKNHFGPFDYRIATPFQRKIVEDNHFTLQVESLTRGMTGTVGGDIDYTLKVFPNHPRALLAMSKLARREGREKPAGSSYTVECWFERAIAFQPEDAYVRLAYGVELLRNGHARSAIEQLETADKLGGNDANVYYNLGLAYFDLGDYEASMTNARRAYALGFPLPGLRDKLQRVGKWNE